MANKQIASYKKLLFRRTVIMQGIVVLFSLLLVFLTASYVVTERRVETTRADLKVLDHYRTSCREYARSQIENLASFSYLEELIEQLGGEKTYADRSEIYAGIRKYLTEGALSNDRWECLCLVTENEILTTFSTIPRAVPGKNVYGGEFLDYLTARDICENVLHKEYAIYSEDNIVVGRVNDSAFLFAVLQEGHLFPKGENSHANLFIADKHQNLIYEDARHPAAQMLRENIRTFFPAGNTKKQTQTASGTIAHTIPLPHTIWKNVLHAEGRYYLSVSYVNQDTRNCLLQLLDLSEVMTSLLLALLPVVIVSLLLAAGILRVSPLLCDWVLRPFHELLVASESIRKSENITFRLELDRLRRMRSVRLRVLLLFCATLLPLAVIMPLSSRLTQQVAVEYSLSDYSQNVMRNAESVGLQLRQYYQQGSQLALLSSTAALTERNADTGSDTVSDTVPDMVPAAVPNTGSETIPNTDSAKAPDTDPATVSNMSTNTAAAEIPEAAPAKVPDIAPAAVSNADLNTDSARTSGTVSVIAPGTVPDTVPNTDSAKAPDTDAAAVSNMAPNTGSATVSATGPNTESAEVPEAAPAAVSNSVPDTGNVEFLRILLRERAFNHGVRTASLYDRKGNLLYSTDDTIALNTRLDSRYTKNAQTNYVHVQYNMDAMDSDQFTMVFILRSLSATKNSRLFSVEGFLRLEMEDPLRDSLDVLNTADEGNWYLYDRTQWKLIGTREYTPLRKLVEGMAQAKIISGDDSWKMFTSPEEGHPDMLLVASEIPGSSWTLIRVTSLRSIRQINSILFLLFLALIFVIFFIMLAVALGFTLRTTRVIRVMERYFEQARPENGQDTLPAELEAENEITVLAHAFRESLQHIHQLTESVEKQKRMEIEQRARRRQAEIIALQSQMDSHLIGNVFTSMKFLILEGNTPVLLRLVEATDRFLRNGLVHSEYDAPLEREIEHVNAYIELQTIRFSNRLTVTIQPVEESLYHQMVPRYILQPLVENAIRHGMRPKTNLHVDIRICRAANTMRIVVEDNGAGMSAASVVELNRKIREDGSADHIGLKNVRERLILRYGFAGDLTVESLEGEYTRICITLPYPSGGNDDV